jgi:hypothetical protein
MASDLCTRCGERVPPSVRFCPNCGNPLADGAQPRNIASVKFADIESRLGAILRAPLRDGEPAPQSEEKPWGVGSEDLNQLLACSFMNTPMDTEFLLLANSEQQWEKWLPVVFIENMQGLKVLGHGAASCYLGDEGKSPSIRDRFRSKVLREVQAAVMSLREQPYLALELFPFFKPMDYGQLDRQIRGRWVTAVDNQSQYEIVSVLPLPVSGWMMKQRLLRQETSLKGWIAATDNTALKEALTEALNTVQTVSRQIPDSLADHVLCRAHMTQKGKALSTILTDEEQEAAKSAPRVAALPNIPQLATATPWSSPAGWGQPDLTAKAISGTLQFRAVAAHGKISTRRFP